MINLTINGIKVQAPEGSTILEAARSAGIDIPTLCYDKAVEVYGSCGLCVVEAEGIPKLLRSCSAKVSEGMVVNTESERVVRSRKIAMELLMSAHDGDCVAPCQLNCPARTDCQGYVGLIANGEYDAALKLIKNKISLPASIGRVCPHPCEKACRRQNVEEPINIAQLKAFAADMDLKADSYIPEVQEPTGKKVAVIGGGPAGLTAAYYLTIMGHSVTVYDMMDKMGGMLRYGIPQYRLPKEVLDKEIAIIEKTGVKFVNNSKLGVDYTIESLKAENDAVIVAVGAWKSSSMRTP
ncbi:MAG: (2Fe-2S)-binding protein, partial [Ruminococcus sp.]|nr:(2Fe-2S)-binding protein [Ruminococcus sp.]